jgi:hypothetical protein
MPPSRVMGVTGNTGRANEKREGQIMNTAYLNSTLRQLRDQQVRFAPRDRPCGSAPTPIVLLLVKEVVGCFGGWQHHSQ